ASAGTGGGGGAGAGGAAGSAGSSATGASGTCAIAGAGGGPTSQAPGTWLDVTVPDMGAGETEDGIESALVDPVRPSDVYVTTDARGVFKSTDYGLNFVKVST